MASNTKPDGKEQDLRKVVNGIIFRTLEAAIKILSTLKLLSTERENARKTIRQLKLLARWRDGHRSRARAFARSEIH